jgi:transposase-like protein
MKMDSQGQVVNGIDKTRKPYKVHPKSVHAECRRLIREKDLTYAEAAAHYDVTTTTISNWCKGMRFTKPKRGGGDVQKVVQEQTRKALPTMTMANVIQAIAAEVDRETFTRILEKLWKR